MAFEYIYIPSDYTTSDQRRCNVIDVDAMLYQRCMPTGMLLILCVDLLEFLLLLMFEVQQTMINELVRGFGSYISQS